MIFKSETKISPSMFCTDIGSHELTKVTEFKYRGIILGDSLTWSAHVKNFVVSWEWGP